MALKEAEGCMPFTVGAASLCDIGGNYGDGRDDLRCRPARRAPERARDARAGGARRARLAPRLRTRAAHRGGLVRARRPRAADGGRRGSRRGRPGRRRRAVWARAQRAWLRALHADGARPGELHAGRDGELQPAQRERLARRGRRTGAGDPRRCAGPGDRDGLVRLGLPVRRRGRSGGRCRSLRTARRC